MLITKIRRPNLLPLQFVPYSNNVWYAKVSWDSYAQPSDFDSSFDFTTPALNTEAQDIESFYVDNVYYELVASIVLCEGSEETFYFDIVNQYVYVHLPPMKRFPHSEFGFARVAGYSSGTVFYDTNGIEYSPYLRSSFVLTKRADRLNWQKISFVNNSFDFVNVYDNVLDTNEFDQYIENILPGSEMNLLYISDKDVYNGGKALTPLYTGYAKRDYITRSNYSAQSEDKRAQLNTLIPTDVFLSADYPDASASVLGGIIPYLFYPASGVPAICTNDTILTGNVEYKFAKAGTAITTVYVETGGEWAAVTPVSTDPANGGYVLSATDARSTSGKPKNSKVDATGVLEKSAPDKIRVLLEEFFDAGFNSTNFDTVQWAYENSLQDITGGGGTYLYMDQQKPFIDWVEELQNAGGLGFIFDIDANGKYTIKTDWYDRPISAVYPAACNVNNQTPIERDFTNYASSIKINYAQELESGTYQCYTNDVYKTVTVNLYRYEHELVLDTQLITAAEAQAKSEYLIEEAKKVRNYITISVDSIVYPELYDIIQADTSTHEIIDNTEVITRNYAGSPILKIHKIVWDFTANKTTISGYDITDIRN